MSSQNKSDIYYLDEIASWNIVKIEEKIQYGTIFTSQNEYKIKFIYRDFPLEKQAFGALGVPKKGQSNDANKNIEQM